MSELRDNPAADDDATPQADGAAVAADAPATIRVQLPTHLRRLAGIQGEVVLEVTEATQQGVLDALEARYPMLRGTMRDHGTRRRRDFVRFFACQEDLSHEPADSPLPAAVIRGDEPFLVIGAVAGG